MVSEFAVQAILKKCVNKIINIDPIDCFIVVCVFINLYINAIGYINRCFSLFFSEDYSSKYWQCT